MMDDAVVKKEELPLCACGCGKPVTKPGNVYLRGHHATRRAVKTAVRQQTRTSTSDNDAVLVQDMALAQQVISKVLKGGKDNHTINIITVGPIQIGSRSNGNNHQNDFVDAEECDDVDLPLPEALRALFDKAVSTGELPDDPVDRKVRWLVECEKVLCQG